MLQENIPHRKPLSTARYELFELSIWLKAVMGFPTLQALAEIGLAMEGYGRLSYLEPEQQYPRSQDVAEACAFLGADGLRAPSARDVSQNNLIVFCEQGTAMEKAIMRSDGTVDFTSAAP